MNKVNTGEFDSDMSQQANSEASDAYRVEYPRMNSEVAFKFVQVADLKYRLSVVI